MPLGLKACANESGSAKRILVLEGVTKTKVGDETARGQEGRSGVGWLLSIMDLNPARRCGRSLRGWRWQQGQRS